MKADRRQQSRTKARRSPARVALVVFTLFALLLQGLATQTHLHPVDAGGQSWTFGIADRAPPSAAQKAHGTPAQDDLTHCAFCDAIAHSGAFVAAAPALLVLPSQTYSIVPLELTLPAFVDAASHFWRGRAPPKA